MFSSVNLYQKKNPFSTHWGQMYIQKDSIAMGWPFSVIFKNFYISTIKERVFCHNQKLPTYVGTLMIHLSKPTTIEKWNNFSACSKNIAACITQSY